MFRAVFVRVIRLRNSRADPQREDRNRDAGQNRDQLSHDNLLKQWCKRG
jgi:hypothetical protein